MYLLCQQLDTNCVIDRNDTTRIILLMTDSWMDRARNQMQRLGISQEKLATDLSCTRGAIGHYLSGRRKPTLEQLDKIAQLLNVNPAWLLYGQFGEAIQEEHSKYTAVNLVPITGTTETGGNKKILGHLNISKATPSSYALKVTSTDWAPRIHQGEIIFLVPEQTPEPGDEVLLQHLNKLKFCNLIKQQSKDMTVSDLTNANRRYILKKRDIIFVHTIIAVFRTSNIKPM